MKRFSTAQAVPDLTSWDKTRDKAAKTGWRIELVERGRQIGSKEKISLVCPGKNRVKDRDATRGTGSDWQEDWSL